MVTVIYIIEGWDLYFSQEALSKLVSAYCDRTARCDLQESYTVTPVETRNPFCCCENK